MFVGCSWKGINVTFNHEKGENKDLQQLPQQIIGSTEEAINAIVIVYVKSHGKSCL